MAHTSMAGLKKATLVEWLKSYVALARLAQRDPQLIKPYETARDELLLCDDELMQLQQTRFEALTNTPPECLQHLQQACEKGSFAELEALQQAYPETLLDLAELSGLGSKRLLALWHELGVRDLQSLIDACQRAQVRGVHGFGEQLETRLQHEATAALSAIRRPGNLLGDIEPLAQELLLSLQKSQATERISLAGPLRQSAETLDVVDIVVATQEHAVLTALLHQSPTLGRTLLENHQRFVAYFADRDVRLDVRFVAKEQFVITLLWRTGNAAHWQQLENLARERGYSLCAQGLYRDGINIALGSEAEFYGLLGLGGIPAELRQGTGELDAARARRVPKLVKEPDILGCVHSHSTWSDGAHSLLEMARAASQLGFRYLTITEHTLASPSSRGLNTEDVQRQWDEISWVQEEVPNIKLLRGIEVDIGINGSLDLPDTVLRKLDIVIGSIHQRFGQNRQELTERILHVLDHPYLHILGHPFGRLLGQRAAMDFDFDAVAQKAKRRNVALEVNGNPLRLDLSSDYVRRALSKGCKLVLSSDAHCQQDLSRVRYAVRTARRGWATRDDVLNTLSSEEFIKSLHNKPHGRTSSL